LKFLALVTNSYCVFAPQLVVTETKIDNNNPPEKPTISDIISPVSIPTRVPAYVAIISPDCQQQYVFNGT
jgi:hypothetical protein